MAKGRRSAVCGKRRVIVTLLIAIFSFIALSVASILVDDYYLERLKHKRSLIKVGMNEQELLQIMGQPAFCNITAVAGLTPRGFPGKTIPNEVRERHPRLVEYFFASERILWSRSVYVIGGVFLDENRKNVVWLTDPGPGILELSVSIPGRLISMMAAIVAATGPAVGFWLWCKKRSRDSPVQNTD